VYRKDVGYGGDFVYGRAIGTDKVKDEKDLTMEFENETSVSVVF
jgi:nucleosome assembly protein 1-like 1